MKKYLKYSILSLFTVIMLTSCEGAPVDQENMVNKLFGSWQSLLIQLGATLILILIVGKFFMKPVREILQKRQDHIMSQISTANLIKEKAEEKEKEVNERISRLNVEASSIIDDAKKNAETIKENAYKEIEEEKIIQHQILQKQLEQEKISAKEEIRKEILEVALQASEVVLQREVSKKDNQQIVENFIKEVKSDE
ncbi:MAG: F0F1 ATP synthase subunit B [Erysipelotrichaceae bacterium]|nr:F0F1 ATP synthase subunit B [Erysipelotrichaceae bacterium]